MVEDTSVRDDTDANDLNAVADQLEAALEKIARHLDTPLPAVAEFGIPPEVVTRLDGLIARLRLALAAGSGGAAAD